jgi:hypothetical protein
MLLTSKPAPLVVEWSPEGTCTLVSSGRRFASGAPIEIYAGDKKKVGNLKPLEGGMKAPLPPDLLNFFLTSLQLGLKTVILSDGFYQEFRAEGFAPLCQQLLNQQEPFLERLRERIKTP